MRYIDMTGCKSAFERGTESDIHALGELSFTATRIAEKKHLGILKNRQGIYRIIRECGLGAYSDSLSTLAEVDDFLKHLDRHKNTKY